MAGPRSHFQLRFPAVWSRAPILALLLGACASDPNLGYPDLDQPIQLRAQPNAIEAPETAPPRPRGVLYRAEVHAMVDAGLGYFLQHVEVSPALEAGRFVGFRVERLEPREFWQGVDLLPGDVVTRINDMPIERPVEAHQAFESLRTAERLKVTLIRNGQQTSWSYPISDRSPPSKAETQRLDRGAGQTPVARSARRY